MRAKRMYRDLHPLGVRLNRNTYLGSRCRYAHRDGLRIRVRIPRSKHLGSAGPGRQSEARFEYTEMYNSVITTKGDYPGMILPI
jgi:hypothetical protein